MASSDAAAAMQAKLDDGKTQLRKRPPCQLMPSWTTPEAQTPPRTPFTELLGTAMRDADEAAEIHLEGTL